MTNQWELLDWGFVAAIPKSRARYQELLKFHWDYYSDLAFQRSRIYDSLRNSLLERAVAFEFSRWQRAVTYRYCLEPLSTKGSLVDPGGRFNIGLIDASRFPPFPALYVASDKATALAEHLSREKQEGDAFTPEELALADPTSITAVSVSGRLESVFDVRQEDNLVGFMDLMKDFRISNGLLKRARRMNLSPLPKLTKTPLQMAKELMWRDWRFMPMQVDIPANSQIFGRIALDAGIEGILYASVLTRKDCLAVYPQNFLNSSAFIELDDPAPTEGVPRRIDSTNYRNFISESATGTPAA